MDNFVIKQTRKRSLEDNDSDGGDEKKIKRVLSSALKWTKLSGNDLNCDYTILYNKKEADALLQECEKCIDYNSGELSKVKVFGKWHDIPRKQVSNFINETYFLRRITFFLRDL